MFKLWGDVKLATIKLLKSVVCVKISRGCEKSG